MTILEILVALAVSGSATLPVGGVEAPAPAPTPEPASIQVESASAYDGAVVVHEAEPYTIDVTDGSVGVNAATRTAILIEVLAVDHSAYPTEGVDWWITDTHDTSASVDYTCPASGQVEWVVSVIVNGHSAVSEARGVYDCGTA